MIQTRVTCLVRERGLVTEPRAIIRALSYNITALALYVASIGGTSFRTHQNPGHFRLGAFLYFSDQDRAMQTVEAFGCVVLRF